MFFFVLKNVYLIWKSEKKRILKIYLKYILYKDYIYKIYVLNVFFNIYKNITYIEYQYYIIVIFNKIKK